MTTYDTQEWETGKKAEQLDVQAVMNIAEEAGMVAGESCTPAVMIVRDSSTGTSWNVEGGCCGFAWVSVIGTSRFAKLAKQKGVGHKSYSGGYDITCSEFGQSMARKEAYCIAYAEVLNDYGIDAYCDSRMD